MTIYEKNVMNIEKENLIKKIVIDKNLEKDEIYYKYIIFGYNIFIRSVKLSTHWGLDATFNFTIEFKQLLILMYLDNITNKYYPFFI